MAKTEERLDDLERRQERLDADVANAAQAIRDQKGSLEKLLDSLNTLSVGIAGTKGSIRVLLTVISLLFIPILYSLYLQWGVHTTIGALDERTKNHAQDIRDMRADLGKIKEQKAADVKAVDDAATTLKVAIADFETARIQAREIEKAFHGPELVMFITLTKKFAVDSSEGDAVLSWDSDIADIAPGRRAEEAVVIHIASPAPPEVLPGSTLSVKIMDGRKMRVRMAMNSQEDKARIEKFFAGGGTMAMDVAIYLAAK